MFRKAVKKCVGGTNKEENSDKIKQIKKKILTSCRNVLTRTSQCCPPLEMGNFFLWKELTHQVFITCHQKRGSNYITTVEKHKEIIDSYKGRFQKLNCWQFCRLFNWVNLAASRIKRYAATLVESHLGKLKIDDFIVLFGLNCRAMQKQGWNTNSPGTLFCIFELLLQLELASMSRALSTELWEVQCRMQIQLALIDSCLCKFLDLHQLQQHLANF